MSSVSLAAFTQVCDYCCTNDDMFIDVEVVLKGVVVISVLQILENYIRNNNIKNCNKFLKLVAGN